MFAQVPKPAAAAPQITAPQTATSILAASLPKADEGGDAPTPPPVDLYLIPLSTPIKSHKGSRRELRLRRPVAADYIEIGRIPFDVRGMETDRRAVIDFKCAAQWLSRLTDLDEIELGQMDQNDFLLAVARLNMIIMTGGTVGN